MTNENNDKQKLSASKAQQHQPQTGPQAGQQQKQAGRHDEKSCTNPDHNHGKDKTVPSGSKPGHDSKATR